MKNYKLEIPNSQETPNNNHQRPMIAPSGIWRLVLGASLALGCCCWVVPARAQQYSIDWFTIDGSGGTSTGGVYQVSGTIVPT